MAAAFVLGAEGVQMGTRMVASLESPVHPNWKQAILDAPETGTVLLNRLGRPSVRALRTARTVDLEKQAEFPVLAQFATAKDLYFGGDMEASLALCGQVAGYLSELKSAGDIVHETVEQFRTHLAQVAGECT